MKVQVGAFPPPPPSLCPRSPLFSAQELERVAHRLCAAFFGTTSADRLTATLNGDDITAEFVCAASPAVTIGNDGWMCTLSHDVCKLYAAFGVLLSFRVSLYESAAVFVCVVDPTGPAPLLDEVLVMYVRDCIVLASMFSRSHNRASRCVAAVVQRNRDHRSSGDVAQSLLSSLLRVSSLGRWVNDCSLTPGK